MSVILPFVLPLAALMHEIYSPPFHSPIRRKSRGEDGASFGGYVHDFCNFDRLQCCNVTDTRDVDGNDNSHKGVHMPKTIAEVQRIVQEASSELANARDQRYSSSIGGAVIAHPLIRVIGAGHSMSPIVCSSTTGTSRSPPRKIILMSLDELDNANDPLEKSEQHLKIEKIADPVEYAKKRQLPLASTPHIAAIATVSAGMRLKVLNEKLWDAGYSLLNTGMIAEQSIGGVTSTSVHGTGFTNTPINERIVAMQIVLHNGTLATFSWTKNAAVFKHARMHLGLFGVVVSVSLEVRSRFYVRRFESLSEGDADVLRVITDVPKSSSDSTKDDNGNPNQVRRTQVWWFAATNKSLVQDMIDDVASVSLSDQERLEVRPSWMRTAEAVFSDIFMLIFTSLSVHISFITPVIHQLVALTHSNPREFVMRSYETFTHPGINYHSVRYSEVELFVPVQNATRGFEQYKEFLAEHLFANETRRKNKRTWCDINAVAPLRTAAADTIPLSPAHGNATVCFSFTMVYRKNFEECARQLQERLKPLGGRPHWGKQFAPMLMNRRHVEAMYGEDNVKEFAGIVKSVDPMGLFRPELMEVLFMI